MGGRSRSSASRLTRGTLHDRLGGDLDLLGRKHLCLDDLEQPDLREHGRSPAEAAVGKLRERLVAAVAAEAGVDGERHLRVAVPGEHRDLLRRREALLERDRGERVPEVASVRSGPPRNAAIAARTAR